MSNTAKKSAGLLLYRRKDSSVEVFLAHMGGPFWEKKDDGSWSIPKGEFEDETPLDAALREFHEETGLSPQGNFMELAPVKQPSGKTVFAYALEFDCDPSVIKSNTFSLEWPKGSGVMREFPEIDRAAWFSLSVAKRKMLKGQIALVEQLQKALGISPSEAMPDETTTKSTPPPKEKKDGQLSFL
jgi:predicted NUDIX family NTP pyrophosphohydrolase